MLSDLLLFKSAGLVYPSLFFTLTIALSVSCSVLHGCFFGTCRLVMMLQNGLTYCIFHFQ